MKSTPTEWPRSVSQDMAAAISVLGIPVSVDQSVDTISGRGWKTFLLGMESVPDEDIGRKSDNRLPNHQTKTIMGLIRNKQLKEGDPHHPCLDVLRACKARDCLQDAIHKGTRYRLAKVQGADRYMLVPGEEDQSIKQSTPGLVTRSLKLAASLSVLGCPLVRIGGTSGSAEFHFALAGYGQPPVIAADLAQAYRNKRLEAESPEHPLLWMMMGLLNWDAIGDHAKTKGRLLLIRAPGTGRASLVPEDRANGKRMDAVKRHLRIN